MQNGHSLVIQGDGANDVITVRDNGQGGVTASITLASGVKTIDATGVTSIEIDAGGGNDSISYALTGALSQNDSLKVCMGKGSSQATLDFSAGLVDAALAVHIDGGKGDNEVTTQFGPITDSRVNLTECLGKGDATSHVNFGGTLSSSLVTATVNGGAGADEVFVQLGNVSNSNLQFFSCLGKGANSFDLEETGSLQNSVVHFHVDGGSGGNSVTFNANEVNVDETSRLNLDTCPGAGNDTVTVNYSGQMDGELDVKAYGGQGNDTMNVDLTLEQGSTGRIHAHVNGGAGDDVMSLNVYDHSNPGGPSTLSLLDAVLNGGSGHNTLTATPNVKVVK